MSSEAEPRRRRSGLGRRLDEVIETHGAHARPAHLMAPMPATDRVPIMRATVVETADSVSVEVESTDGAMVSVPVVGSLDGAVVEAVSRLLHLGPEWDISLASAETLHGDVIVATARNELGVRVAGAACVESGRPWAIARAVADMVGD